MHKLGVGRSGCRYLLSLLVMTRCSQQSELHLKCGHHKYKELEDFDSPTKSSLQQMITLVKVTYILHLRETARMRYDTK